MEWEFQFNILSLKGDHVNKQIDDEVNVPKLHYRHYSLRGLLKLVHAFSLFLAKVFISRS